jgi:hypothetical protein
MIPGVVVGDHKFHGKVLWSRSAGEEGKFRSSTRSFDQIHNLASEGIICSVNG